MNIQSLLKSKWFTWPALGLLALTLSVSFQLYKQKNDVYSEIEKLEKEAQEIQIENTKLSSLINYYSTPEFLEKEAREKLNLKKDGEVVVALPKTDNLEEGDKIIEKKSNIRVWYDYFFNQNNE